MNDAAHGCRVHPVRAVSASLPLRARPDLAAPYASELLSGEPFEVFERRGGWARGQSLADDYVGYVREDGLSQTARDKPEPAHRISVPFAQVYPEPEVKAPPMAALPFGARIFLSGESRGKFLALDNGGWIPGSHAVEITHAQPDLVATALMFRDCPYLWGGRTAWGLDCSALVQLALMAAGVRAPRDSGPQQAWLEQAGRKIRPSEALRGDLVFWPGHVGLIPGDGTVLHANAHHMRVTTDPLADVSARVSAERGHIVEPTFFRPPV